MHITRCLTFAIAAGCLLPAAIAGDLQEGSQRKARVVVVFDDKCLIWCSKVLLIMKDMPASHGPELEAAELKSSRSALKESTESTKQLGTKKPFEDAADYASLVMIFDNKLQLVTELAGAKKLEVYQHEITRLLARN